MPVDNKSVSEQNVTNILLPIVTGGSLASMVYFGAKERPTEMAIMLAGGIILIALLKFDDISRLYFKVFGLETTIEKANKAVEDAYTTVAQVKKLAKELAIFGINSLATANRYGASGPHKDNIIIKNRLDEVCKNLEIEDPELEKARGLFYKNFLYDHMNAVAELVLKQKNGQDIRSQFGNLAHNPDLISTEAVQLIIEKFEVEKTPEIITALEDLDYFYRFKTFRKL